MKSIIHCIAYILVFAGHAQIDNYLVREQYTVFNYSSCSDTNIFLLKGTQDAFVGLLADNHVLYRLDMNLNIKDSIIIKDHLPTDIDRIWFFGSPGGLYSDTLILVFHTQKNNALNNPYVFRINPDFSFIDTLRIDTIMSVTSMFYDKMHQQFIVGGSVQTGNLSELALVKTDVSGHVLVSNSINPNTLLPAANYATFTTISVFDNSIIATIYPTFSEQIAVFDTALVLQKLDWMRDTFMASGNPQLLSMPNAPPKVFTMVSRMDYSAGVPPPTGYDTRYKNIGLITMDSTFSFSRLDTFLYTKNRLYDTIFGYETKLNFGTFAGNHTRDTVVVMATNIDVPFNYFLKPATWTYIHSLNASTGQNYWTKIYNNGYAHDAQAVVRLPDNKWLLAFNEYNWDKYPGESICIHLIIIDSNGNPIDITEDEEIALNQEPVVFPNPAQDYLSIGNLHWPGNTYTFQLTDLSGRIVQSGDLPINGTISLPERLNGIYLLTITNQTGFGWARKIVID